MKKKNYHIRQYDDFKNIDKFKVVKRCDSLYHARIVMEGICSINKNGSFALIQISGEDEITLQKIENTF